MVGHQAIRPHRHAAPFTPLGQELAIGAEITRIEKRRLPAIAPLRDMVRVPRNNHTRDSGHEEKLRPESVRVKEISMVSPDSDGVPRFRNEISMVSPDSGFRSMVSPDSATWDLAWSRGVLVREFEPRDGLV
jgi:hypothetical protein